MTDPADATACPACRTGFRPSFAGGSSPCSPGGKPVAITHHGKVVARLNPPASSVGPSHLKPWEQLHTLGGRLRAKPSESVLRDEDFEVLR